MHKANILNVQRLFSVFMETDTQIETLGKDTGRPDGVGSGGPWPGLTVNELPVGVYVGFILKDLGNRQVLGGGTARSDRRSTCAPWRL